MTTSTEAPASRPREPRPERKLPVQQLAILSICRFAEPIASTSLFPYLPEMIRSFGVPEKEVGTWAGTCSAMFSVSQAIFGVPWGRFSDIYGRRIAILLGLVSTMLTSILWGFSRSLPLAIVARSLQGAGNGNVGILRTTVAEMVPYRELQPRAFSLLPLVWNIGTIFGPSIGGSLANPLDVRPGEVIENPSLFQRYPYLLPNIVTSSLFLVGISTGFLFLEETLASRKSRRDWGLRLGDQIKKAYRQLTGKKQHMGGLPSETEPLLKNGGGEEGGSEPTPTPTKMAAPTLREVLTPQSLLNLYVYSLLAMHSMAFEQQLPVFMQFPSLDSGSGDVTPPFSDGNPLKFASGFSLDHYSIGVISTCYGVLGMLVQFFVFPGVARRFGILLCYKWAACVFPISYFLMPFTALLPTQQSRIACCFVLMAVKSICSIFAFPCSTILLTNSASSLRVLATLNGCATSFSAVGRAVGPFLGGALFTFGVKSGYVVVPFWIFTLMAVLGAIPVFWIVEGEGFGDNDDNDNVDDDSEDDETTDDRVVPPLSDSPRASNIDEDFLTDAEIEEDEFGRTEGLLSRATTVSMALTDSDEQDQIRPTPANEPRLNRKSSRASTRAIAAPIGMGNRPISRRYSSNLGQSLGMSGSHGA